MLKELFSRWFAVQKSIPVIQSLSTNEFLFKGTSRTLTQTLGQDSVSDPYATHAWVRGAIESVALNMSSTPLMWKNTRNKPASDNDADPWVTLFEKPNELMGLQQLFEATVIYLLHFGECMWVLDRTEPTAMPKSIEPFNGKLFEAVTTDDGRLKYWAVETRDKQGAIKRIPFQKWEVCFFRLFNPYDKLRGLAPLDAAQLGIDQDTMASQYNKAFFKNSALPGGVIEIEEEMTDDSFNRMRQQFADHHQGMNKAHMLAILEGGAKYKQLVPSQKDMEFLNQKKWNRDEILACFKVPKLELGIWDDVNFAVAKVQAREFWTKTLLPKMHLIEWVLWTQLFSVTGTGKIFAEFDTSKIESLQGDMVEKVDMAFKLWQMGYPINSLNDRFGLGLPVVGHGNAAYVMNNVYQVEATGAITLPIPALDPNAKVKAEADAQANATAEAKKPKGESNEA